MQHKLYILAILLAFACANAPVYAQSVPFGLYPEAEFSPDFDVIESNSDLIRFSLDMSRLQPTGTIDLTQHLPGTWGEMNADGSLMPRFTFYLALPPTGNPTVTIEEWTTMVRLATPRNIPENTANVPRVLVGDVGIFGGVRLVPITVKPITYTNNNDTCYVLDLATIRIDIDDQQGQNPLATVRTAYSEAWRSVFQAVVMNWQYIPNLMTREPSHLLMVVPSAYMTAVADYVTWKEQLGMQVTIVPVSEIDDDNSGIQLRNRIISELNSGSSRVDHVVLVGDETVIPVNMFDTPDPVTRFSDQTYPGPYTNEGYFTELEGNDAFPDVFLGRWPVSTQLEARNIATRTVAHERDTFTSDSLRFEICAVSADHSVDSQRETIAYARQMLLAEGFQLVDTVYSEWTPSPEHLIELVNDGVTFVNHRGSGWGFGWAGINFGWWNVPQITNPGKLCIVTGIGCGVGKFDEPDGQCFGEAWMTAGTVANPQGAVGFIGPCWNTHTVYNDNLDTCLYKAMLEYNIDNLAPALVAGKMFAWAMFADFVDEDAVDQVATVMMRQYLVLSDPSLMVFTNTPDRLPITFPSAIPSGPFQLPFVIAGGFETDVDSLIVAVRSGAGESFSQMIPAQPGTWHISVDFDFGDSITATVSGQNVLAFQQEITVAPFGVYLIHQNLFVFDEGNNNGRIEPGESISVTDTVWNIGSESAFAVTGTLSSTQEHINITSTLAQYGTVAAGASLAGLPPFVLTVTPEFRGRSLAFEITYNASGEESRSENLFLTLYSPELDHEGLTVVDGDDGLLERYEEAGLSFTVTNTGNEPLVASTLQLESQSPFLIVIDGTASIPALAPNQSYLIPDDAVRISAAWNAPTGTQVTVDAVISAQMSTYQFSRSLALPLVLGQVGPADPMAGSDGTYFIYDDLDVDYDRVAVYDWVEISPEAGGSGTLLPFTQSHQTFSVPVPFNYSYFGQNFSDLSISTDGWVAPGVTEATNYQNRSLPYQPDFVSGMIAVMWNDLWWFFGDTCEISYNYDAIGDRFIVEWHNISSWGQENLRSTFQLQLLNPVSHPTPTGDAEWVMLYQDLNMHMNAAGGATVGYESLDELNGATYFHNGNRPPTSAPFENGRAIRISTAPPTILDAPEMPALPSSFSLSQNFPNPFNPETTIEFTVASRANVRLEIFDVLGRNVITLAEGTREAGIYRQQWNGKSYSGISVPSGIYFYRLATPEFVETKRMLLMR